MRAYTCVSNLQWVHDVAGSRPGVSYDVRFGALEEGEATRQGRKSGWTCSCPAFRYRKGRAEMGQDPGECKHIRVLRERRCGWNVALDPSATAAVARSGEPRCPRCGEVVALVSTDAGGLREVLIGL